MTQPSLNRRLTTIDSTFLYLEKAEQPMHIGGCMLYEGRVSREELARVLAEHREGAQQADVARADPGSLESPAART